MPREFTDIDGATRELLEQQLMEDVAAKREWPDTLIVPVEEGFYEHPASYPPQPPTFTKTRAQTGSFQVVLPEMRLNRGIEEGSKSGPDARREFMLEVARAVIKHVIFRRVA